MVLAIGVTLLAAPIASADDDEFLFVIPAYRGSDAVAGGDAQAAPRGLWHHDASEPGGRLVELVDAAGHKRVGDGADGFGRFFLRRLQH